ncbi:MAG TPA: hypothetical protein VGL40_13415 [Bacillota bacterium]|jgi:hypothetical protein
MRPDRSVPGPLTPVLEITPERRDEIIEWAAQQIHKRGLTTAAVFFIEMNRPITYVGSQAVHFFAPFVNTIFDNRLATEIGHLMSERKNIDRLINRLEDLIHEDDVAALKAKKKARAEARGRAQGGPEAARGPVEPASPGGIRGAIGRLFRRK